MSDEWDRRWHAAPDVPPNEGVMKRNSATAYEDRWNPYGGIIDGKFHLFGWGHLSREETRKLAAVLLSAAYRMGEGNSMSTKEQ